MCDEYDDERMKALWRALAEAEKLAVLSDHDVEPVVVPLGAGPGEIRKPHPRTLAR